jgi:hypothetical protein
MSEKCNQILEKDEKWFPLYSPLLQSVSRDYSYEIRLLVQMGVIEQDKIYIVGKSSRKYRFTEKYSGQDYKWIKVNDFQFRKTINKARRIFKATMKANTRGYSFLTRWFDENRLTIDVNGAKCWIDSYKQQLFDEQKDNGFSDARINNIAVGAKLCVEKIHEGDFRYNFDDNGRRFHTNLTNLKKELRRFIRLDGEALTSIDLKNSQPYLALKLFDPKFWSLEGQGRVRMNQIDLKGYNHIINNKRVYRGIIMLVKEAEIYTGKGFQPSYSNLVCSGEFYEYLINELGQRFPDRFGNRELAKKEVLRIMYMNPNNENWRFYAPCKGYKERFPSEYNLFGLIKSDDYKLLPRILQRLERYLIIDCICRGISKEIPEAPIFTIHDSIVTTKANVESVKMWMKTVFEIEIGHPPMLAIETWD